MKNHYSFRAECMADVLAFLAAVARTDPAHSFSAQMVDDGPDMACTLCTSAWLVNLTHAAEQCEDCHRIAETLHIVA